ncbi:MAG: Stp1/IreP family PP2C-type Ser/Thr phosphatase [Actinomycetota bacterium]
MTGVSLGHAAATDIGSRRANEDAYLMDPPLFAVADGMGGHVAGEVASRTALSVLAQEVKNDSAALLAATREANRQVHEKAGADLNLAGMGTTMTAFLAAASSAQIVHVGDSRAYLLRGGRLTRLTEDHTLANRLVRQGRIRPDEADRHPQRSVLERALGVNAAIEVDVQNIDVRPGDRFLLCTDGLTSVLVDEQIQEILLAEADPQAASHRLVSEVVEEGGEDNVTAVIVDYPGRREGAPSVEGSVWIPTPTPPPVPETAPPSPSARPSRGRRRALWLASSMGILLLLALAARMALGAAWYVGDDEGRVAVFQGIPGSLAGIRLNSVAARTDIPTDSLTEVYQRRLREGMPVKDRTQAESFIREIGELQQAPSLPEATSSPQAGPKPPASPTVGKKP